MAAGLLTSCWDLTGCCGVNPMAQCSLRSRAEAAAGARTGALASNEATVPLRTELAARCGLPACSAAAEA